MGEQLDLFRTDTKWFHVFRSMILNGDCAAMGPHGFSVYSVIKAHVDWATGRSHPSVRRISDLSNVSLRQVARELDRLEELGHMRRSRSGHFNTYHLLERFPVLDVAGTEVGAIVAPYIPDQVKALRERIKAMLTDATMPPGKGVNVTINIQINAGNGVMVSGVDIERP